MKVRDRVISEIKELDQVRHIPKECQLFIYGVKPAWITVSKTNSPYRKVIDRYYPAITFPNMKQTMYFRDADTLRNFVIEATSTFESTVFEDMNCLKFNHELLGRYLGYPDIACRWYAEAYLEGNPELERTDKAFINYHGLQFVCGVDMVDACFDDLVKTRPVPKEVRTYSHVTIFNKDGSRSSTMRGDEFTIEQG